MRDVHGHEGSALNNAIRISADERDESGASHSYEFKIERATGQTLTYRLPSFQQGPLKEAGPNGISDEALIAIVIDRLEGFNTGKFRSLHNANAITKLHEALHWLKAWRARTTCE